MSTPTKEQLEKLADVAEVEILKTGSYIYYRLKPNVGFRLWQPENDRYQIALVIEGLTEAQLLEYNELLIIVLNKDRQRFFISFGQTVHPSISFEKLLEVIG